jgi:hypothetical protein
MIWLSKAHSKISELGVHAKTAQSFEGACLSSTAISSRKGVEPHEAFDLLMHAHRALQTDPVRAMTHLAQQYGISSKRSWTGDTTVRISKTLLKNLSDRIDAMSPKPRAIHTVELVFMGKDAQTDLHHFSPARDRSDRIVLSFGDSGLTAQQRWTVLGKHMAPHIQAGSISEEQVLAEAAGDEELIGYMRWGFSSARRQLAP